MIKHLIKGLNTLTIQKFDVGTTHVTQANNIAFQNEEGYLTLIGLQLKMTTTGINYMYFATHIQFKPSKPYYILTDSSCDFFGCESTDTIVYMPATITTNDVNNIINTVLGTVFLHSNNILMINT